MDVDEIALTHGPARWVLWHAFHGTGAEEEASFDAYLKYLRRHGVPFRQEELAGQPGLTVTYRFEHLMEVALALALKRQGILRVDVVRVIAACRDELRPLFRQAWDQRESGLGQRVAVAIDGEESFSVSGVWLDLMPRHAGGMLTIAGDIRLMGPAEALMDLSAQGRQLFAREPIKLSDIAIRLVALAAKAPDIRRGRR